MQRNRIVGVQVVQQQSEPKQVGQDFVQDRDTSTLAWATEVDGRVSNPHPNEVARILLVGFTTVALKMPPPARNELLKVAVREIQETFKK